MNARMNENCLVVPGSRVGSGIFRSEAPPQKARESAVRRRENAFSHSRGLSREAERQAIRSYATEAVHAFAASGVQPWEVLYAMRVARREGSRGPATWTDVLAAVIRLAGEDWVAWWEI
jgi:hypothetical protein